MKATEAREYIDIFTKYTLPGATYVELLSGEKINFDEMTDAQAVKVAHMLMEMEAEAYNSDEVKQ